MAVVRFLGQCHRRVVSPIVPTAHCFAPADVVGRRLMHRVRLPLGGVQEAEASLVGERAAL